MQEIIFIGTLHAGLTPHDELKEVLEQHEPAQLLVEIDQSDIIIGNLEKYPVEMRFAYEWAKENNIPVFGFDTQIDTFATGKTEKDNLLVINEQTSLLKQYTWKDANTRKVNKLLDTPNARALVDQEKEQKRENVLLKNIVSLIQENKKVVILTGAGHLDFFEKHFLNAVFPFRQN